jgi:uncharacterized protein
MAKSNRDRVGDVMDILRDGLGTFVIQEYKRVHAGRLLSEISGVLNTPAFQLRLDGVKTEADVVARLQDAVDTQGWLKLMWQQWNNIFQDKLGKAERSYVSELTEARNDWAHQQPFSNDDAYRIADTATRLLQAINAPEAARRTQDIASDLLRLRFKAEEERAKAQAVQSAPNPIEGDRTTRPGLKPWRLVVQPHPDVAGGRYVQAEFAADIAQVHHGSAEPEYGDPLEFFRRTYLTQGLLELLATGIRRLTGQGGDPVVQLQTAFGGGKTHSMIALYHLASGKLRLSDISGGDRIVGLVGNIDLPQANRAVLVGTDLSTTKPRQYPDATTHTLWGEMAYQLGGAAGYALVESDDLNGVNPGANTLLTLLEQYGPALIIIDEFVAYARNLYGNKNDLPAGTFDAVMSFTQSLTEAVRRSSDSILLVSIPQSKIEIGGDGGQAALEILSNTIGRLETVWKPVTATESFEIVRRRLFADAIAHADRDAVVSAFMDMYRANKREFPSNVIEAEYAARMRDAYPIHPELFDRLYQDWSTLERFQRTRGVLRLMAAVIYNLWISNDQSLLIMPGTVPLYADTVRSEILRYPPGEWSAIVDTDIDGTASRPYAIDTEVPALGRYAACRRVGRSIFIGSAPSVAAQGVRGVDELNIRLATVQPGEPLTVFGDALKRMSNQLTYLYGDGSRYWYDTRPTVNKMARDRAQVIPQGDIELEVFNRLKSPKHKNTVEMFTGTHIAPASTGDVVDEARVRVVVFGLSQTHKRGTEDSEALKAAREMFEWRGNAQRHYRNMLLFIAPDQAECEALDKAVRDYLAWQSIKAQEEELNLDAQQRKQVKASIERADESVDIKLQTAYSWLIVPVQPDPTGPITMQPHKIAGEDAFYLRAARKLKQSEFVITQWSPDILRSELDKYLWRDQPHLGLKQLWEYLATYVYLPRLRDQQVLVEAIHAGVTRLDAPFAYAAQVGNDGKYHGLVFRTANAIYFDTASVVIRPEIAQAQLDAQQPVKKVTKPLSAPEGTHEPQGELSPPPKRSPTRYYGSKSLDAVRVSKEMDMIVDEVLQHLISLGCEIDIRLEITARYSDGFDEATLRTLRENSTQLKFNQHGFEGD